MATSTASVRHTISRSGAIAKAIRELADVQVMVGIPKKTASRTGSQASNALIGYVLEHGVPKHNLPPRPFLVPGVRNARAYTKAGFKKAARYAMAGNQQAMQAQLAAIGTNAAVAVKLKMRQGPFAPLAPRTIAARQRKLLHTKKLSAQEVAAGFQDIRPLIDTGKLLASITWVIRKRSRTQGRE